MNSRTGFALIHIGVVWALFIPAIGLAQLPPRLQKCSPYPTLAQEIREMWPEDAAATTPKVVLDRVEIEGKLQLPIQFHDQLISDLMHRAFNGNSDWLDEIQNAARGVRQDRGYFRAKVEVEAADLGGDEKEHRVAITVRIAEGGQYWLREIHFRTPEESAPVFPVEKLRQLIPIRDGELFSVAKIRDGLIAMQKAYSERGYIDFTVDPTTDVDEERGLVFLRLDLNEQLQYRQASVEFLSLDSKVEAFLKSQFKLGEPLNPRQLLDFIRDHKSLLPADASERDVQIGRDLKNGTVNLLFDFRTCESLLK